MSFLNMAMLAGLIAVAIPPIIHLLNRRRYEIVDWGAMQFLQISEVTRRRILIEEILLMALRMGLIAVLVLALADPFSDSSVLSVGQRTNRDVVLVIDGSASMSFDATGGKPAYKQIEEWSSNFLDKLTPGDGVAVVLARKQPILLVPHLSRDLKGSSGVFKVLQQLPEPGGSSDLPRTIQAAYSILDNSQRSERDIIVLGDGQRFGWTDTQSMLGWKDLASKHDSPTDIKPKLWAVNLDPQRPAKPSNWSLAPLTASRAVVAAEQTILFRSAILLSGPTKYEPPDKIEVFVDGKSTFKIDPPKEASLEGGQIPFSFELKVPKVGTHLVSVVLEPDPPREQRKKDYVVKDQLPLDNRRDFAVEVVPALPVLLIDGEEKKDEPRRASDFIKNALAPENDKTPVVKVHVVTATEFNVAMLREENKEGEGKPRVVILSNVPKLNPSQEKGIETFLKEGGGVLVAAGNRVEGDYYNNNFYREGRGWLPGSLSRMVGDEVSLTKAARPERESLKHPALDMFRRPGGGGIDIAWFSRWWKLVPPENEEKGVIIAKFNTDDPLFIEGRRGEGRIILSAIPLDNSWTTNLTSTVPGYVPLVHELVYYLAAARAGDHNLEPGQPMRYRLPKTASQQGLMLQAPSDKEPRAVVIGGEDEKKEYPARLIEQAQGPLIIREGLTESGVWKLTNSDKETIYYVVQSDARESDLTPFEEKDRTEVGKSVNFTYENETENLIKGLSQDGKRQYFWWLFLVGVILLLCSEVWMTRKIVKGRE